MNKSMDFIKRRTIALVLFSFLIYSNQSARAEEDPFPGVADGAEVSARQTIDRNTGNPADGSAPIECPYGSGRSQVANATTKEQYIVCKKNWRPTATINADKDFEDRKTSAQAAALEESRAWNAANPGKQKCVEWGPIVHANGVSTASGGVCANPVEPGSGTSVPTESAPSVEAPENSSSSSSGTSSSTSSSSSGTSSSTSSSSTNSAEDYSNLGNGYPFTRVLKGQLSTSECPSGFQAANGLIAAIGIGTFTECWPENAWAANRLGGSIWEQFKNSGGTYDAKAEIDRRNKVNELKALAKSVAQTAADQTPGIQRCSKWTGYGESGEECAYTFVSPSTTTESTSTKSTQETSTASTSSTASSEGSNSSSTTASLDPFPSLKNGEEIPNTRIISSPGLTQSEWEQTSTYRSHTCPSGSGRASGIDLNFTISKSDDKWFTYCIKSFQNSTLASGNTAEDVSKSSSVNSQTSTSDTSTASTSTSDTSTASTSTSDTSNASTSSSSTDPQVSLQDDPTLQTSAIQVSGSIGELKPLVSKVVEDKREARAISSLMSRLDAVVSKTSIKKIKLPGSSRIDETVVSLTPEVCSVSGLSISSQAKGTCVLAFTVTDTNGNTFTTEKEIYFRK